jgi:uncharacterized protein YndB with AHSA1/START domain
MFPTSTDLQDPAQSVFAAVCPAQLNISASVQIKAEVSRVLFALAIPEYMEAWLRFPEIDRIECHAELRSFDRFRIDMYGSGCIRRSLYGSCLLSKSNRITYLWEREPAGDRPKSTVEIRLWGGPESCTVNLRHTGFWNQTEAEWHSEMWSCSLENLCRLMEGMGVSAGRRASPGGSEISSRS